MKRKLFSLFLLIGTAFIFATGKTSEINVGVLNGPTCIPAAYLMEKEKSINFESFADPQALLPKMIKKEIDIGFMPLNVAAKVYNSGNKAIICCAVTGFGNICVITTDQKIRTFTELKGKTVYVAGQGATPEYMMRYLLNENGLTCTTDFNVVDVMLDFSIPTAQLSAQLISGKIKYAVVPEPFVTIAKMKSSEVRAVLDFQEEYKALTGSQSVYPLSVMVVRKEFAENNPELLESFLEAYKKSLEWTLKNPQKAGSLSEKHSLGLTSAVVTRAIPSSNYTFIPAAQAVSMSEELLEIFLQNDPSSIGGKLPEREFYYERKTQQ